MSSDLSNKQMYDLYNKSVCQNEDGTVVTSRKDLSPVRDYNTLQRLPEIKGTLSHDQFLKLRDVYVSKSIGQNEKPAQNSSSEELEDLEAKRVKKRSRVKRPSPLLIGFNELGIDDTRKVLYRNFH